MILWVRLSRSHTTGLQRQTDAGQVGLQGRDEAGGPPAIPTDQGLDQGDQLGVEAGVLAVGRVREHAGDVVGEAPPPGHQGRGDRRADARERAADGARAGCSTLA
jgi:hypothetical protein